MTSPAITPLPTPPARSDTPAVFTSRADALLGGLPNFVEEANALGEYVTAKAAEATLPTLILEGYSIVRQTGTETIGSTFTSTSTGALGAVRGLATLFEHETVLKWVKWTPRTSGSGAEARFYRPNEDGTYAFVFAIPLGTVTSGQLNTEITVDVSGYGRQVFPGWVGAHYTASQGRISTIAEPCLKFVGDPAGGAIEFKVANERPAIQFIGDYDEQLGKGAVAKNIEALDARATQLELTEPTNGVWFGSRANTRRTIAGINDVMNGVADFEILVIGDSFVAGSGSGSGGVALYNDAFRRSFPGLIARALKAAGVPVSYHSIWGCHNTQVSFPAYCPYATQGAGWVYGGQAFGLAISAPAWTTLGGGMFISPVGGANGIFGYTPPDPVDHFKIGIPKRSDAGTLQWRVDGGAWHDLVQTASSDDYVEVTLSAADDPALATVALHTLEQRRKDDSGWAGFAKLDAWDSTRKTVRIHNAGHAGALATTTLMTTPSPWSPLPRLIAQTAGLVIYNPATNDCREGKTPAQLMAAQKLHLAYFKASGSDALLLSMAPQDPAQEGSAATIDQQLAFAATTKAVAKAGGATFVDLVALFGSWADANAAGKYVDYIHLNQAGYQMLAGAIMQQLGPISGDAVAAATTDPLTASTLVSTSGGSKVGMKRASSASGPLILQDKVDAEPKGIWSHFGVSKTGATISDSAVDDMAAYVTGGGKLYAEYDGTFKPGKKLSLSTGGRIQIDGQNALFLHEIDDQLFSFTAPIETVKTVTAIEAVTADYSANTVQTPTQCTRISMSEVGGLAAGDFVKLACLDPVAEVRTSDGTRKGEWIRIASVDAANARITTYTRILDTYTVGNGCVLIKPSQTAQVEMRRLRIASASANRNGALVLTNFLHPRIRELRFERTQSQALRMVGCYNIDVDGLFGRDLFTGVDAEASSLTLDATGYLLAVVACQGGIVRRLAGHNCRHLFTTSPPRISTTPGSSNTDRWDLYGGSKDILVDGIYAEFCQGVALDTHDDAARIQFRNFEIKMAFNGPRNANTAIGLRGRDCIVGGGLIVGGSGVRCYTDSTDVVAGSAHGGHLISDIAHQPNPNETYEVSSLRVSGNAVNRLRPCRVEEFKSAAAGIYSPVRVSYGKLVVARSNLAWASQTGALGLVRLEAGGQIECDAEYDLTGTPAGTGARLVKWDDAADTSCSVKLTGRLITPAISAVAAAVDFSGKVGTADVSIESNLRTGYPEGFTGLPTATVSTAANSSAITVTTAPSGGTPVSGPIRGQGIADGATVTPGAGSAATLSANASADAAAVNVTLGRVVVDVRVTGYGATNPAINAATLTAAAGTGANWRYTFDPIGRGQREIYWQITTDQAGGAVSGALPGAFTGQRARIENAGSTSFLVWRSPSTKLNLPYNITLGAGEGLWIKWDGTYWVLDQMAPPKYGSKTWAPGTIAAGAPITTTVTVSGAVAGDVVAVGHSTAPAGAVLTGVVTAANTVTVTLQNSTSSAFTVTSGTVSVTCTPSR